MWLWHASSHAGYVNKLNYSIRKLVFSIKTADNKIASMYEWIDVWLYVLCCVLLYYQYRSAKNICKFPQHIQCKAIASTDCKQCSVVSSQWSPILAVSAGVSADLTEQRWWTDFKTITKHPASLFLISWWLVCWSD